MATRPAPRYEGLLAETVGFAGHTGDRISGHLARPLGAGPYPGVIVIHEVFGLVPHIKEVAQKFAGNGFVALAPDLHDREGPGNPEDVAAAVRAAGGVPDERAIGDLEGGATLLKSLPQCNGKIGVIGYCSGGRQTFLFACNTRSVGAAVVCYGGRVVAAPTELSARQPQAPIDMAGNLSCPLLGLFGAEDRNPAPEHVERMRQELTNHHKTFEFQTYQNAGHAFFADYRPSYRQEAAVDGWQRVFAWFSRHLAT